MIVFLLKGDKKASFKEYRKKKNENSYLCRNTRIKPRICSVRAVGCVNKVKDSSEPDSNQRPKDINYASTLKACFNASCKKFGGHVSFKYTTLQIIVLTLSTIEI